MVDFIWRTAYSAFVGFFTNRLSTCAAAMAFYTLFALGPTGDTFSIAVAEPFVGRMMAQQAIFDALGTVIDAEHLQMIQRFASEDLFRGGGVAALIGALVLIYTGTRVFVELDDGSGRHLARSRQAVTTSIPCWPASSRAFSRC